MATVFNTLAFSRRLQKASFTAEQSDALADAVHEAVRGSVATKADLEQLRDDLHRDMTSLERRMATMFAGGLALTVAILGALISLH